MKLKSVKIVADSSCDLKEIVGVPFAVSPLKIVTDNKEYIDDDKLDVFQMVKELSEYSGRSSTACPSPIDWLKTFDNADYIFCVTITSSLSGSYNSACIARNDYEEQNPGKRVFVIDTLSTGPEMYLIIEKLNDLINEGLDFDTICDKIKEYKKTTSLIFMLESMKNLANNGRVSHLTAKAAGLLGIRVVGIASEKGELAVLEKPRGEKKALNSIVGIMKKSGFKGGKVKISHCFNKESAQMLEKIILNEFSQTQIEIYETGGLCSFYVEKGGLLVGFENHCKK